MHHASPWHHQALPNANANAAPEHGTSSPIIARPNSAFSPMLLPPIHNNNQYNNKRPTSAAPPPPAQTDAAVNLGMVPYQPQQQPRERLFHPRHTSPSPQQQELHQPPPPPAASQTDLSKLIAVVTALKSDIAAEKEARRHLERELNHTKAQLDHAKQQQIDTNNAQARINDRIKDLELNTTLNAKLADFSKEANLHDQDLHSAHTRQLVAHVRDHLEQEQGTLYEDVRLIVKEHKMLQHALRDLDIRMQQVQTTAQPAGQGLATATSGGAGDAATDQVTDLSHKLLHLEQVVSDLMSQQGHIAVSAEVAHSQNKHVHHQLEDAYQHRSQVLDDKLNLMRQSLRESVHMQEVTEENLKAAVENRAVAIDHGMHVEMRKRDDMMRSLYQSVTAAHAAMASTVEEAVHSLREHIQGVRQMNVGAITSLHHSVKRIDKHCTQNRNALRGCVAQTEFRGMEDVLRAEIASRLRSRKKTAAWRRDMESSAAVLTSRLEGIKEDTDKQIAEGQSEMKLLGLEVKREITTQRGAVDDVKSKLAKHMTRTVRRFEMGESKTDDVALQAHQAAVALVLDKMVETTVRREEQRAGCDNITLGARADKAEAVLLTVGQQVVAVRETVWKREEVAAAAEAEMAEKAAIMHMVMDTRAVLEGMVNVVDEVDRSRREEEMEARMNVELEAARAAAREQRDRLETDLSTMREGLKHELTSVTEQVEEDTRMHKEDTTKLINSLAQIVEQVAATSVKDAGEAKKTLEERVNILETEVGAELEMQDKTVTRLSEETGASIALLKKQLDRAQDDLREELDTLTVDVKNTSAAAAVAHAAASTAGVAANKASQFARENAEAVALLGKDVRKGMGAAASAEGIDAGSDAVTVVKLKSMEGRITQMEDHVRTVRDFASKGIQRLETDALSAREKITRGVKKLESDLMEAVREQELHRKTEQQAHAGDMNLATAEQLAQLEGAVESLRKKHAAMHSLALEHVSAYQKNRTDLDAVRARVDALFERAGRQGDGDHSSDVAGQHEEISVLHSVLGDLRTRIEAGEKAFAVSEQRKQALIVEAVKEEVSRLLDAEE